MDLLERERHLAAFDTWLREAAAGQGRLVLVGGEAGVGKTALVDRVCQDAQERARVLRGACDALSTPRPLGPLLDITAVVGGEIDRLLSEGASRDRVFRAVLTELSASSTPTLVVVEDAHWADEGSLDLLRFLGRRLEATRTLLVITYRDDEAGPRHPLRLVLGDLATTRSMRRLELEPLSESAIEALAAGSGFDPLALHRLTGGNAFYATEVLAHRTDDGIPATVRDAVLARASRLPPAGRDALDVAAVIGSPIGADLLTEVARAADEAIEACLSSGMLVAVGEHAYAFRHELAREAIYGALSLTRRRELHERVLAALRGGRWTERDLARLAHHAEAAGDMDAVLRFAPAAARRASALYAHRESAAQYARALRFADDWPPLARADLLEDYSYECYLTGRLDEAITLRRAALSIWRTSVDRLHEGDALRWISRFTWFSGRNDEAVAAAEEALAVLETQPPGRELAMALSNRAQLHMLANENDAAILWGERAIALAEALDETEILVHALNNVGAARVRLGDEGNWTELERSLALARAAELEDHVARAWVNLSWSAIHVRDLPRAEAYYADGIAYTTDHDLDGYRHYMLSWRGNLNLLRGDWLAADRDADEVLAAPNTAPTNRIAALTVRGLLRARRGAEGVVDALDEALALAEPTGEIQRLRPVRIARAEAAWLTGDSARAAAETRAVLDLTLRRGSRWDAGDVLHWLDRCDPAGLSALPPDARDLPEPYRRALDGDWAGAASAWNALGCPYDAALALLNGDEAAVRRALATFEELGAQAAVAIATRRLRDLGARGVPRGPRPATRANPANLTARELEIVPHLAAGRRNAEIAERLFLSPKTVGHHVSSILAKLDIHSRGEVAAAAFHLGLSLTNDQDRLSDSPR